jgi:hypothetical protein
MRLYNRSCVSYEKTVRSEALSANAAVLLGDNPSRSDGHDRPVAIVRKPEGSLDERRQLACENCLRVRGADVADAN